MGDVTGIVGGWVDGTEVNYGFLMKAHNEDQDGYDVRFRSSEYSDMNYRPYLSVNYRL